MMDYYKKFINKGKARGYLLAGLLLGLAFYFGVMVEFDFFKICRGLPNMYNLIERMMSPNYSYAGRVFTSLMETLEMAVISSIIGVLLAIPLSLITASNTAPNRIFPLILNPIFAFLRTIPNLIWAALLVSIFSIGSLPGITALSITAFLISLKLFREQIESINVNVISSVKSVGASHIQILRHCIIPSINELTITVFFMVLEVNVRGATILGLVGAGGIGQILWRDLSHLRYDNIATLILMLFVTIAIIDLLSLAARHYSKSLYLTFNSLKSYRLFHKIKALFIPILLLVLFIMVANTIDISYERLMVGIVHARTMLSRMVQIDVSYYPRMLEGIKESLFIALFATLIGAVNALFLSYVTAYNISPFRGLSILSKFFINILRTFPPIITAIIFFRGVGPGPLAGAMALTIYTTGVLTKLYSEVLENTNSNIKDSILVVGGSKLDAFRHGVYPHTFSTFISLVLYRLESNIRTSTILGVIGAGGIGSILTQNINWRNWERVGLLLLGVAAMIITIDIVSHFLRRRFI